MLEAAGSWRKDSRIAPLIVLVSALLVFSINLDRPPDPDELHHVLAAQHLIETGRPVLAEGEYTRGILHTWMVALSYEAFGEGLPSARIPSVLLVALTALVLFVWVRREAGPLAAWLAAALFISSPFTVEIAQFSRFYGLQMFSFMLGSMCLYYTLVSGVASVPRRVSLGVLAGGLMFLAVSAQVTTLFGLVGVAVWTVGVLVQGVFLNPAASRAARKWLAAILILAGILAVLAATVTDALEWAWENYRYTQLFNVPLQNQFWYYHLRFILFYPTLWSLVGVFAVFAIVKSPKLSWYAISVFSISFLLMSFAGTKATRYLSFAPPFLAIVWGVGLAHIIPLLLRYTEATRIRFTETLALPQRLGSLLSTTVVVVVLLMVVLTNPFWLRTATVVGGVDLPGETPTPNWPAAREALAAWTTDADIMITTEELGPIYFLGRSDVAYSPSKLPEIPEDQQFEFGIDHRTGRPVITEPESLEQLIDCFPRGLIVGPIGHWGLESFGISQAVQTLLSRYATPIDVPEESNVYAWGWTHAPREPRPSYCSDLSRFSGARTTVAGRR